jgi:hypothetical protein
MDQTCFSAVIEGMYFLLFIMNGDDGGDKLVVLTTCLYSCVCFAVSCTSGDDAVFHIHTCHFSSSIFTKSWHYTRLTSPAGIFFLVIVKMCHTAKFFHEIKKLWCGI